MSAHPTITPVIVRAASQSLLVDRFLDHIDRLYNTHVLVLEGCADTTLPYPACNNAAFRQAALAMSGHPFLWLEPDSPPIRQVWLDALTATYYKAGREFLLSSDSNPPHDMIGGIGIYGPNTRYLIPATFPVSGWDLWMHQHLAPVIARTPLIQHSYGVYDQSGHAEPHRFPRDAALLRPTTVLFHRDKFQDLLGTGLPEAPATPTFYHTGDLGDIVAALPIIRQLGGGHLRIGNHDPLQSGWRLMEGPRYAALQPLLATVPYLHSVEFAHHHPATYDFEPFRKLYQGHRTLTATQADWLKVPEVDMSPWLSVTPSRDSNGLIVVARTRRYHNPHFPWRSLVDRYSRRMIFVGLDDEYKAFVGAYGIPVTRCRHAKTPDLLRIAELIAGSDMFIGNQSVPCWIAMALGHPLIQETWPTHPDSIVPRSNARYGPVMDRSVFARMGLPL